MAETIYLVGIGTGSTECLTVKAKALIEKSDLICGAKRMVEAAGSIADCAKADTFVSCRMEEISEYLRAHRESVCPVVLLSGDVGFYSGASKLLRALEGLDVELVPGISSLTYFCAKLKIAWESVAYVSCHGRNTNLIYRIVHEKYTFALLSDERDLYELADKLLYYGLENVNVYIGERLSYEDEKICRLKPGEIKKHSFDKLLVLLAENPAPKEKKSLQIHDEEFIRGEVPMTKCEVRTVSIAKLGLDSHSVVYDIGAGTGSVSIQTAMCIPDGTVYAVERNESALSLIEANKKKFAADNLQIVQGEAPEILSGLQEPTHAFIGGSAGKISEILDTLFWKNPAVTIVINAISLETASQVLEYFKDREELLCEIVQISVAKAKKAGKHHLYMGQNPVTVMVIKGCESVC